MLSHIAEIGIEPNSPALIADMPRLGLVRESARVTRSVQPSRPVVLGGFGNYRCERRGWIVRCDISRRRRGWGGGFALMFAIRLPSDRQAQEEKHRTCRQNMPGIADQECDEKDYRDENRQHHFRRHAHPYLA